MLASFIGYIGRKVPMDHSLEDHIAVPLPRWWQVFLTS